MVPTGAWPEGLQLKLANEDVSRPSIGGQSQTLGESVAVQVENWKSGNSTKGKKGKASENESKGSVDLLTRLSKLAKRDKRQRNMLDFKQILLTLKDCVSAKIISDIRAETVEVNILQVPGNGCCFPHSCSLSVMLSANPEHGFKFL